MATNKRRLALLTCADYPTLAYDDRLVFDELNAVYGKNIETTVVMWDDPSVDWSSFQLIVVRSPWDYFWKFNEFASWLDRIEQLSQTSKTSIANSPSVLRWNFNKHYLQELSAAGLPVVPTEIIEPDTVEQTSPSQISRKRGWQRCVVKPIISANSFDTWLSSEDAANAETEQEEKLRLSKTAAKSGALVQEYLPQITTIGEYSFVFVANEYSHAVKKVPYQGDFRVQENFGGQTLPFQPPEALLTHIKLIYQSLLNIIPTNGTQLLYARIDGVCRDASRHDTFLIMEIELFEPSLYLVHGSTSPSRFASAIASAIAKL